MKLFFQIIGFPVRVVVGLAMSFLLVLTATINPPAARHIPGVAKWIFTGEAEDLP